MRIACFFLIFVAVKTVAFAAVAIYPYKEKPAEFAAQKGCYLKNLNRVLPYDEPYYPIDGKTCLQYKCQRNNETLLFSCGATEFSNVPANCRVVQDFTLAYPNCCKTLVCDTTTTTTEPPPCDY